MAGLPQISEDASLAIHAMALLARHSERRLSNAELAATLGGSRHTLAKALQRLAAAGLVLSIRGPHGGFVLGRPAEKISLLEIYQAVEGPFERPGCLLGMPVCNGTGCVLGDAIRSVFEQLRRQLAETSLARLASGIPLGTRSQVSPGHTATNS